MQIEIVNWEKYNPRSDAKFWSWFRLENDFFEDEDLYDLTPNQILIFLFCCCRRSKKGADRLNVNVGQISLKTRTTIDDVVETLRLLEKRGKLHIHNDDDVRELTQPYVNVREGTNLYPTNVTNVTNVTDSPSGERVTGVTPEPPFRASQLQEIWNTHCGTLPKAARMSETRKRKIRARWAEEPSPDYWQLTVQRMAGSTFCCEGKWASFDWLVANDTNHVKVNEGKYDNRDVLPKLRPSQTFGRSGSDK